MKKKHSFFLTGILAICFSAILFFSILFESVISRGIAEMQDITFFNVDDEWYVVALEESSSDTVFVSIETLKKRNFNREEVRETVTKSSDLDVWIDLAFKFNNTLNEQKRRIKQSIKNIYKSTTLFPRVDFF